MKGPKALIEEKNKLLAARAEDALLDRLPVDQKTLRRAARYLEPKNLKRIAIAAAGGSLLISLITSIGHDRLYRAAVAREMRKQLEPVKQKLEELEAQNLELHRQNEELRKLIKRI